MVFLCYYSHVHKGSLLDVCRSNLPRYVKVHSFALTSLPVGNDMINVLYLYVANCKPSTIFVTTALLLEVVYNEREVEHSRA